jgi:hypothetical protein
MEHNSTLYLSKTIWNFITHVNNTINAINYLVMVIVLLNYQREEVSLDVSMRLKGKLNK